MPLNRARRAFCLAAALLFAAAPAASGAADGTKLDLPKGADVAIVVFEDLQCPDCAKAHPQIAAAAKATGAPLVIRDFPLARHAWAFPAAILARHFSLQSREAGLDFRTFVFLNQALIRPENLRQAAEEFAKDRGIALPENVDPDGRLQELVQADYNLGRLIGLEYVPLILVIAPGERGSRYVEVKDPAQLQDAVTRLRQESRSRPRN
jgi:protein-disulfide isomerase